MAGSRRTRLRGAPLADVHLSEPSKADRREARRRVAAYHEAELAALVDRLRDGLRRYDAGELDVFEFDELVHRYKKATQELWKFSVGGGSYVLRAARTLDFWEAEGDRPDWWESANRRRRRR
jgi:hypothetical protein